MPTLNRNSWSAKEEAYLDMMLDKYEGKPLDYTFKKVALKLHRSLDSVRSHYQYHKMKIEKANKKREFISLIKKSDCKLTKKSDNLYIVEL